MAKLKVLILSIFTFLFLIACGGDSSIVQNTSSSQVSEESNPPTSEDNNTSGSEGDESGNAEGTKPTPPISEDNTSGSKNDDGENTEGNQPTPPINEGDNSSSKGDESDNTEGNQPTPPISEDSSEEASSDAEELPQEPQVEVKYTSVGEKSNEVATVTCEEVYELGADNKKYSLFPDINGDYIAGSTALCSLKLKNGLDKKNISKVVWTIIGTNKFDNPEYAESILLHWTDKEKVALGLDRCMYASRFVGGHKIQVDFNYNSVPYSITFNTARLSSLTERKFDRPSEPQKPINPNPIEGDSGIPTVQDDPLDCSKSRYSYDGAFLYIGNTPSSTLNGGKDLPIISYANNGFFDRTKTYAFIRIIGNSTKDDFKCQNLFGGGTACPHDFRFQTCSSTENKCYVNWRNDYLLKDTQFKVFHDISSGCRVKIPLDNAGTFYSVNTGFQYNNGRMMNFPFYVGDPSFILTSNKITFISVSVDNLWAGGLLGGQPNFARQSNVTLTASNTGKADNNIALFTLTWGTYDKQYNYAFSFDGWTKLP